MAPIVVDNETVRRLFSRDEALDVARTVLLAQSRSEAAVSTPAAMALDGRMSGGPVYKIKAATVATLNASGVRLLPGVGPGGERYTNYTAIYDHERGDGLSGLVAENWLSRLRTAAFGVAAVEGILPERALKVGLFGSGDIAVEIVPLLAAAHPIEELRVWSRTAAKADAFAAANGQFVSGACASVADHREVVDGADLVITLTDATEPLVRPGWMAKDAIVMSMGSHNEVDFGVLEEADTLIVDDPDYATNMGDGGAWVNQGRITREALLSRVRLRACDLASDFSQGRRHAGLGRVMALIQGMAIGDVAFAVHAFRKSYGGA